MKNSLKLLGSTLALNFRVIKNTLTGDADKVKKAFDTFNKVREKYDAAVRKDLKYFYKFYNMEGLDGLGGYGPRWLLFAANPLVWVAAKTVTPETTPEEEKRKNSDDPWSEKEKNSWEKDPDDPDNNKKPEKTPEKTAGLHPDLQQAMKFFGYGSGVISEASEAGDMATPRVPPEAMKEAEKIQGIAKSYVENEKKHAEEILKILQGRVAFIKKLAEAKTFEELQRVAGMAASVGIKWSGAEIDKSYKAIESELQKKQKENPEEFKKTIEGIKKAFPELKAEDPISSIKNIAFGMAKSEIQGVLVSTYNQITKSANDAMGLPVDQQTAAKLGESEIGRQYLQVLRDFTTRLESGSREVGQLKNVFKGSKT
jgi:hypothetical protein